MNKWTVLKMIARLNALLEPTNVHKARSPRGLIWEIQDKRQIWQVMQSSEVLWRAARPTTDSLGEPYGRLCDRRRDLCVFGLWETQDMAVREQLRCNSRTVVDDRLIRLSQSRGDYYFLFLPPSPIK